MSDDASAALAKLAALADAGWTVGLRRRDTFSGAKAYVVSTTMPTRLADEVTTYHGAPTVPLAVGDAWEHALRADPAIPFVGR